jgi:acetyl esterase/lipase
MYIHGGGYVACSARTHRPITTALARRTGLPVFSVDYRLAPEHRYPAALDDVVAAYRWLLRTSTPAPAIALAGDSAGGGLVLGLLLRIRDAGLPMPVCAACFSPLADVRRHRPPRSNVGRDHMFHPENTDDFGDAYVGTASRDAPEVSMVNADPTGWPSMLFQVSGTELLLDDANTLHQRVVAGGGRSTLTVYGDLLHCWQMLVGIVPEANAALDEAAAFLKAGLSSRPTA